MSVYVVVMGNQNTRRTMVRLPKDKQGPFDLICSDHNVYPGSVLRYFVEMVIDGILEIPPGLPKKPPSGRGAPFRLAKRK